MVPRVVVTAGGDGGGGLAVHGARVITRSSDGELSPRLAPRGSPSRHPRSTPASAKILAIRPSPMRDGTCRASRLSLP
jgi:hypothetical protein